MSYERLAKKQRSNPFNTAVSQSKPRHRHGEFPYRPLSSMMPHPDNTGMPEPVRTQMEAAFDTDFSDVTIHPNSSKAAKLDALAYTRGHDIHFAPGTYNPGTDSGRRLLGHELAHVVQQREGRVHSTHRYMGLPVNEDPGLEQEADRLGTRASRFRTGSPYSSYRPSVPAAAPGVAAVPTGIPQPPKTVVQGVLTRSVMSALRKAQTAEDIFLVILKYPGREQEIIEAVRQLPDEGSTYNFMGSQYEEWKRMAAEGGVHPGGSEEIEALAEQASPDIEDPEDRAEEYLNEQWHDEDGPDTEEEIIEREDVESGYQFARKGNTISGPKTYKTKKFGQFTGVSYKTDNLGSIDFTKPVAKKTWTDPVLNNTNVNLNEGSTNMQYGFTKNKTKVKIKGASRAQHFSIADRILEKNKININRGSAYTWHHLTNKYEMVLVDMTVHAKHGHNGGIYLW